MIHVLNVLHSKIREHAKRGTGASHTLAQKLTGEAPRSSHWRTIEKRQKELFPVCAACGSNKNIQIHHKKSFKLDADLELHDGTATPPATPPADGKSNFISLCMSKYECHLRLGHGGSFKGGGYNPNIEKDAEAFSYFLIHVKSPSKEELQKFWDKAQAARITEEAA